MKYCSRQDIALFGIQLLVWIMLILAPAAICHVIDPSGHRHWVFLFQSLAIIMPMAVIYMTSFYILVPRLFFRGYKWWYIAASLFLILLLNYRLYTADVSMLDEFSRTGFYTWSSTQLILDALVALGALGLRSYLRSHQIQQQLEEERRKSTEAELTWLKNQLNPHFLFNSLNNISSLTQIDPDEAQEAIAQLSDLLRYALYESNKPLVSLAAETEFMHNYISMMRLRCSAKTQVHEDLQSGSAALQIAPLLFISFIENAFKHGTSNSQPSVIDISLRSENGQIVFMCSNTNFPKTDQDRSGSGVGLENTRRRLDLLYPSRYEWHQTVADNIYSIQISINP